MVRDYELMYIARPELDDEGLQGAVDSVERLVGAAGGTVVRTTNWGRRRLAYEVDHLRDGHYMLLHLRMDGARVADLERSLAILETVFRHLLVLREAAAESEPESGVAVGAGATERTSARQTVVAVVGDDDEDEDADEEEEDDDDDDGAPIALVAATTEEEN